MLPAIQVESLNKKYVLEHKGTKTQSLRETVVSLASASGKRLLHPFRSTTKAKVEPDVFWALKDISFTVEQGDRVGIIGRNGAGKSTLLKILSRITPPTSGRITIHGRVASLLEVGTGFHPDLTGRENIFLNGAVLGMQRVEIRQKFDEIVAFAEVDRFLDTPVKRYSSGMYVRLAFAVAAHLTPEILIVDEVLAVGDAEFQKKCLGVMRNVSTSQGRTVFFVSHNMAAVQALCSKSIVLTRGELTHIGPAQEGVDLYISKGDSSTVTNAKITGRDFELLGIRVSAPDGSPLSTFKPALVQVNFRPLTNVVDAGAHILFEDLNGAAILGLESRDFVEKVRVPAGKEVTASFRIAALPLNPGPFRLRLWLRSHSDHLHWEVPSSFDVNVEETRVYGARQIDRKLHGSVGTSAEVEIGT